MTTPEDIARVAESFLRATGGAIIFIFLAAVAYGLRMKFRGHDARSIEEYSDEELVKYLSEPMARQAFSNRYFEELFGITLMLGYPEQVAKLMVGTAFRDFFHRVQNPLLSPGMKPKTLLLHCLIDQVGCDFLDPRPAKRGVRIDLHGRQWVTTQEPFPGLNDQEKIVIVLTEHGRDPEEISDILGLKGVSEVHALNAKARERIGQYRYH